MTDWQDRTLQDYRTKGFADRSGFGQAPALLVVDFINGFTDPATPLGGDFSAELDVTKRLLEGFRAIGRPIVYTTVAYGADYADAGVFIKKVPSLAILREGSDMVEVDPRIAPRPGEYVAVKKFASAFFGTDVDSYLKDRGVDTLVITGCTTSGCVRASAVDSLQYGYHTIVVSDAVGDRAQGPHEANLFDIDAKYGDVMPGAEVMRYLEGLGGANDLATKANEDFKSWWHKDAAAGD